MVQLLTDAPSLLTSRQTPPPNRLAVHLSPHQITHLTLSYSTFFTHSSQPLPSFHRLIPQSRLANTDPLALTNLTISLHPSTAQSAIHLIRTELLPLFNPSTFTLTILPTPPVNHAMLWQFLSDPYSAPKDFARWDRLERLVLRGVLPFAIASHPYEVVLDMTQGAEWHAGAGGLEMMRLGTRMSPLGRVGFGRKLVLMGMSGGGGGEDGQGKARMVLRVGRGEGEKVREEVERLEGKEWVGRLGVEEDEEE